MVSLCLPEARWCSNVYFPDVGDISSDSDDEALMNVKRVDPAVPVSPLHSLFLHERGLSAGGEGGAEQGRGLTPLQLQHTPALHLHGPQGIGLTATNDDNISVGSDSVDTSMSGAPGMSANRKPRRRIKHPKKGSELPEGTAFVLFSLIVWSIL